MKTLKRFHAYVADKRLCVVQVLMGYLSRNGVIRKQTKQLLISYIRPHEPISRAMLARWTLGAMELAGINTGKFKEYNTKGASVSLTKELGASLNAIMRNASW